ncbi:MAG: type I restriction endonuclease subunit R [Chlorobium sp.]|uniref:type I restriction endonuclease subunit R n=1 Tax=Chlorobium sp. TaxID=1095 RepID=UPI0025BFD7CF|nr:type I restriction endonuclease subunit R [Chlorobium sp.]MCF8217193.1 type I restriction endonuclease subunit R [Chlorobium sp.]MCF8272040.1 type I restriction endonuclease subunit R [Chlorobium sp.]MCF8288411.1 type I restriction endonuclease subunit R [Chlorobium sp.]MCF8292010.1 type I restriction endonuclease subunit R [Chlorobium sp.]MCF8386104.1 type I restriction endonuclease subunit R [Chlorobium sp.]
MSDFQTDEKHLSQIPALQFLTALGYEYLTPAEALRERQGRMSNVLLETILRSQLKEINRIRHKGNEYLFSEENIQSAIQNLKNIRYDGLLRTNEAVYDLITLGTAMEQTVEGDSRSFNLNYIDWRNPGRNRYHVTVEFSVERSRSTETTRPDIVLFVNGIPFCVIECKSPQIAIGQAVSQSIRNQSDEYIPKLFVYTQLLLALNKNSAMYATTGTAAKFWSVWKEIDAGQGGAAIRQLSELKQSPMQDELRHKIAQTFHCQWPEIHFQLITPQDEALHSLCRPERLLELAWKFTVFDGGFRKIARYQQYFVVKSTLRRVKQSTQSGVRRGGVIWHTQGSGKSLTMVMLTRNLALDPEIQNPRIVLVTDRDDLDRQLGNTFAACGLEANRATSGRNLLELVSEKRSGIVTTLIHKFDKAYAINKYRDDSPDIFILVDESHRTQFGSFAARMRQMFPYACYLGFTGTPLLKKEKNNFTRFGKLVEPHYSISQAVEDRAVVPLLYEGRHVEMTQNKAAVDLWFERHTQGLSREQQADLKRKYARAEMLNKAEQVIYMRAFDISEHFRANWQGTGFKAQLVSPNKVSALRYHAYLNEIGFVSSEVVISPPDMREGYEETDDEPADVVVKFWQKMMKRYGSEEEYTKQLINQFKHGSDPEILIVVDKLLTGFDAPRNAVLYLCRVLKEHTLLQAIARVNRIYEGKEFGFIVDYANVLGELDKALSMYSAFEGFDEADLAGTLTSINSEIEKLPGRYSDLWDLFKTVKHSYDEEAYEVLLADDELREEFYLRLAEFAKTLAIALSSEKFLTETDEKTMSRYKTDLRKFQSLRASVQLRYAESIDYRMYEPKIRKLLDTHIQANEVIQLNEPVNIFDDDMFAQVKEEQGVYKKGKTTASRADTIAHATKKAITERMDEDPAFYEKFSRLIQQAIDDYRAQRLSDLEYLHKVVDIRNSVVGKVHDDIPDTLAGNEDAMAYFGVLKPFLTSDECLMMNDELQSCPERSTHTTALAEEASADAAIAICGILEKHYKVHFWDDDDARNLAINEIDDYLYDELKTRRGIALSLDEMDRIIDKVMQVAEHRSKR